MTQTGLNGLCRDPVFNQCRCVCMAQRMKIERDSQFLMGNAPEPLKKRLPNHTADHNNDGIAEVLAAYRFYNAKTAKA